MSKYKYGTARIALFKEFAVDKSYTLEASLYGSKDKHFSIEDFEDIGKTFGNGLYLLFYEDELNYKILKLLNSKREKTKATDSQIDTIEDDINMNIKEFISIFPTTQNKQEEPLEPINDGPIKKMIEKTIVRIMKRKASIVRKSICMTSFPKIENNKISSQENLITTGMNNLYFETKKGSRNLKKDSYKAGELSLKTSNKSPKAQNVETNVNLIVKSLGLIKK